MLTGHSCAIFKLLYPGPSCTQLTLVSDGFEQVKPGLSANADDPQKAAESLMPLMAHAVQLVPPEAQARAPLQTAGSAPAAAAAWWLGCVPELVQHEACSAQSAAATWHPS